MQILVDTILQLEEVISFKRRVEALQQQDVPSNSRYVTQLLSRVAPEQVQAILTWSPEAWTQAFSEAITPLPMLLDVVRREDEPAGDQAAYLPIAEQQLNEVSAVVESTASVTLQLTCCTCGPAGLSCMISKWSACPG